MSRYEPVETHTSLSKNDEGVWDGELRVLANLDDPSEPQDAATKAYVDQARRSPITITQPGVQPLAATATIDTYAPFPTPLVGTVDVLERYYWLIVWELFIDTTLNNVQLAFGFDLTGATVSPITTRPTDRLRLTAKSPVGATMTQQAIAVFEIGTTRFELLHAGGAATVSDLALTLMPLHPVP